MRDSSPGAGIGRLALKIFLIVLVAVALVAAAVAAVRLALVPDPDRPAVDAVSRGWAAFTAEQRDRYARLGLAGRVLAREESLRTVLRGRGGANGEAAGGEAALVDLLLQRRDELGYDFALILDAQGRVVAATDRPDLVGRNLSGQPLVDRGLEEGSSSGVWNLGEGRLAHAAVEWVAPEFDLLGYVLVALELDEVLALEIQRTTGAGAAFLLPGGPETGGPRAVSSSFDAVAAEGLARELAGEDGRLAEVLASGDTREGVELELGGTLFEALLAPLRDAAGTPVGALVIAAPVVADTMDPTLPWLGVGVAAALLLGLFLSLLLARGTLAPVRRLAVLVDEAPHQGYARRPEPRKAGHLAPVAASLRRLFRDLQEERTLSAAAQQAGSVEGAAVGGEAAMQKVVLVGVDLRRYARLGSDADDARDAGERLARELARSRSLVASRGGRVTMGAGHRLLASFEGDDAAWRAVTAAAALLTSLGERESAFDEGDPPAVAVAPGRVASGSTVSGEAFLVGPAVQLVESLLREAAPGDLVLPRPIHAEVADRLAEEGVEAREQSALLSPQPLFVLSAPAAGRLVEGDEPLSQTLPGIGDDSVLEGGTPGLATPGLAAPGDVLEERFEVISVQAGSPQGELLLARDRELGEEVALRRLPSSAITRPEAASLDGALGGVRRFTHPGVARFLDFLDVPGGMLVSREWVPGAPLQGVRDLPLPASLGLGRQLAAALAAVHDAGLVHGRLKPENLVLVPGVGVRLTDLGIGMLCGPHPSRAAGGRFLAPEQQGGRLGDARADVWAYGALLARLTSGRWWTGEGGELVPTDGEEGEGRPLPEGLEALLRRCLEPEPTARYADGGEVLDVLADVSS